MPPDRAARLKELRALLDDLRSKLVRGDLEEADYLRLRGRAQEEMEAIEEEARWERAETELNLWKKAMGALLMAAGTLLFLATTRVLSSGTPVSGPTPESSVWVFLQWFSAVPWAAGALLLFRRRAPAGDSVETGWAFPAGPEETRQALLAVLERRAGRVEQRPGWMECTLGRGEGKVHLALYLSGSPTRTEARVEARLGAGAEPGLLREIREEAKGLLRAR